MLHLQLKKKQAEQMEEHNNNWIDLAILGLENYIQKSNERLITSARRDLEDEDLGTGKDFKARKRKIENRNY